MRLSGVNVGTVDNITIVSDTSVRIEILIDENARKFIRKDAIAGIGSDGLMGNKILIINPGTGGKMEIENNDSVQTVQPMNVDEIMVSLKTTFDHTSHVAADLSKITNNIQSGKGTIGRLLMDSVWRQNFDSSLVNLKQGSEGIKNLFAKNNFVQNVDSTFMNLKEGSDNLKQGLGGIKTLMDSVNSSYVRKIDSTFLNLKKASAE